ncbi:Solute carrier family 22 member 15-like [Nymphon striatum]|nr:Solute carrier family 22 member 15-like [Nymphon striatum]
MTLPHIVANICVPESPRWLIANNFNEKAERVMLKIAQGNKTLHNIAHDWSLKRAEITPEKNVDSILTLFKHWVLMKYTMIQCYTWFISSAIYYGLTLAAGSLGDLYISTILLAAVEIPAVLIQAYFINRIGRRHLLCIFLVCGGISCLLIQFLPSGYYSIYLKTGLALLGKLCSAGEFGVIYIYSAELFPTSIRNSGLGMVSVASRIGGILAPFIVLLGNYVADIHFTIFGLMAFTAGILNLCLPETNKRPLPDSIDKFLLMEKYSNKLTVLTDDDDEIDEIADTAKMLKKANQ